LDSLWVRLQISIFGGKRMDGNQNTNWLTEYGTKASAGNILAPPSAWWIVTRACNLACPYCFPNARKRDPDELTTEEAMAVLDDFAESGVFFVTFLGGEPLCRRDIFDLMDYATDLGIYTAILTNGTLVTEETIPRLQEVGCEMMGVSIDHDDPAIHDAIRGRPGSLLAAQQTLRAAVRAGVRASMRVVVTKDSYEAVPRLFRWALAEGIEELILLPELMVGRAKKGTDDPQRDRAARALFVHALDEIREMAASTGIHVPDDPNACPQTIELNPVGAEHYHAMHGEGIDWSTGCKVGKFEVSVQPNGDIHPCPYVPIPIGNLRQQKICEIWQSPLLNRARVGRVGCMSRALTHTGSPDLPDPTLSMRQ
jgi:MoaA/NifB/PqqE/SkfB family radical SAM enzyme